MSKKPLSPDPQSEQPELNQDALLLRRRFSVWFIFKWIFVFLIVLLVVCLLLVGFVSTDRGTQYFLKTMSDVSKTDIHYDRGNFVTGLWIKDLSIPFDSHTTLSVDKARLRLGWRQIFGGKSIHLHEAYLHEVTLRDVNPPSGKPFNYPKIALPITLRISNAEIGRFVYAKATRKDVVIDDITAKQLAFMEDTLSLREGTVELDGIANVSQLTGHIKFRDHYLIDADATVSVPLLTRQQVSPLSVALSGTLANVIGDVTGKWGSDHLSGKLQAQPVIKGLPYKAVVQFETLHVPYATAQNIELSQGALAVQGTLQHAFLSLNTALNGKDIPAGRYHVTGDTDFKSLQFNQLDAATKQGKVSGKGHLAWEKGFKLDFIGKTKQFNVHSYLPVSARPYVDANFSSDVELALQHDKKHWYINTTVKQSTGNAFKGKVLLPHNKNTVHVVGRLTSKQIKDVPQGEYDFDFEKIANRMTLKHMDYQGVAGRLRGHAWADLSQLNNDRVTWQATVLDSQMSPQRIASHIPLNALAGSSVFKGNMVGALHRIQFDRADLNARMPQSSGEDRKLAIRGDGQLGFALSNGQLSQLQVKYDGLVNVSDVTPIINGSNLSLDMTQQGDRYVFDALRLKTLQGQLNAQGSVRVTPHIQWQLKGDMRQFNPAVVLPRVKGNVTGAFNTTGFWRKDAQQIDVTQLNMLGQLQNQPFQASGKLGVRLNLPLDKKPLGNPNATSYAKMISRFEAQDFKVTWADNHVTASGTQDSVVADIQVASLHRLVPHIKGNLSGKVYLDNLKATLPSIRFNAVAEGLAVSDMRVGKGSVTGDVRSLGTQPSNADVQLTDFSVSGKTFKRLEVKAQGTVAQHRMQIKADHEKATLAAQLNGGLTKQQVWQGTLSKATVGSAYATLIQQQPTQVTWVRQPMRFKIAAHCWASSRAKGELCIDKPLGFDVSGGTLDTRLKNLDIAFFKPFLPKNMAWRGALQGNAKINWYRDKDPKINALFYTDNGSVGLKSEDPQDDDITLGYKRLSVIFASHTKGLKMRLDAKTHNAGNGYIDAIIDPKSPDKTINGAMVLDDIRLSVLKPFFPGIRHISGKVSLAGGMSGPLKGPQYYGNFKLENAALSLLGLPVNISGMNLKSSIRGTNATFKGSFLSGKGKGTLSGHASWKDQVNMALQLKGNALAVRHPPLLYAELDPNIDIQVQPSKKRVDISGQVHVVKGTVRPPTEVSGDLIKQSSDVVVIRQQTENEKVQSVLKNASPWRVNTDVNLAIKKDTYFNGFGARIPLIGKIKIKQSGKDALQGFGFIDIAKRVPVTVFGQSLDLTRSKLTFAGDITQPELDVEALKKISGAEIGLRVEGNPTKPRIEVFNDAGLNEQEAMNALVAGRIESGNVSQANFQDSVNNAITAAGLSMGLSQTRNLTNRIGRDLGLSALTVDASGANDDANVNITGYITPDLYLRYGVGVFTPVNKLTLRYQLSKRVYVEASSAIEKAIDVFYNWRF